MFKNEYLRFVLMTGLLVLQATGVSAKGRSGSGRSLTDRDLLGVWKLTKFVVTEIGKSEQEWCQGANGTVAYLPGKMTVSINCESTEPGSSAEKIGGLLFYSGPFEVDSVKGEVIHRVRNYSDPSLNNVYRRKVEKVGDNFLRLSGALGEGKEVVLEWIRDEKFQYDANPLTGYWELVGSENEVPGEVGKVPFCSGFYGSILYTPGGYAAVSINCGEKADTSVEEPADRFGRRYFYSGDYEFENDTIVQTPFNASEVSQIGKPVIRKMKIEKDYLILEGTNGSKFKATWRKAGSFTGLTKK